MSDRRFQVRQPRTLVARSLATALLLVASTAPAANDVRAETPLKDLRGPAAVAIRQVPGVESYDIYVAEVGAGRVIRLSSEQPDQRADAITGFIASTDDDDLPRLPGPHGLLFLDANRLVVAGSDGPGRPFVRLYQIADQTKPLTAQQHEKQAATADNDEQSDDDLTAFHRIARTRPNDKVPDYLVLGARAAESSTLIWKLPLASGTLGDLSPLRADQSAAAFNAVAVEPRGHIVLVRPAKSNDAATSRIEFVNPIDGRTVVKFSTTLPHIRDIAYSPRTGNLYAIRHSPRDSDQDGVYRIDLDESSDLSATPTLVAQVERPTALAFGPDGALYVTALAPDRNRGTLQKITPSEPPHVPF